MEISDVNEKCCSVAPFEKRKAVYSGGTGQMEPIYMLLIPNLLLLSSETCIELICDDLHQLGNHHNG